MKIPKTSSIFLSFFLLSVIFSPAQEISTKGALIIASVEGQVTVVNNETQASLPAAKVVAGGVIYDGHTIKTGPGSKMILLLTNGTVATVKAESSLNIKKFTQEKFDMSKMNLSDLKGEPSRSETVIDIEIGDMVVDVKKLDKKSSFNIESPVGTAGIRGTVPAISVIKMPDGGFQQQTSMLRGAIAFTPRGGGLPTMLGPGQSLASGIGPNGVMLPMQLGQVSAAMMSAIQADVEAAGEAMGISVDGGPDSGDVKPMDAEEEAPSEDELNESDDERSGASKGVGDDDNGTDAVALEKAGLIDLDDPEQASKADSFVEVASQSADSFGKKAEKQAEIDAKNAVLDGDKKQLEELKAQRNSLRRNGEEGELSIDEQIAALEGKISLAEEEIKVAEADRGKDSGSFVKALASNIDDVVDVTIEMEELGIKDKSLIEKTTENAENAPITNDNLAKVKEVGVTDTDALAGLVSNPDKSDEAAEILGDAEALGAADADTFAAVARSADVADKMKEAKDKGTDVDSVLVAVKTTDGKKQGAKKKKQEAEAKRQEVLASGVEIPQSLVTSIEKAASEEDLTAILSENANEPFYEQLVVLRTSRSDELAAELETQAADNAKTKIVDTSGYIGKVKEIAAKKKKEADEQKKSIPQDVIDSIEASLTIDSTDDEVTALRASYEDDANVEAINKFIDNLKSSFDLDPSKMASGIVDNAETAADNLETITVAESFGVDPTTIATKPEKASSFKEIRSTVTSEEGELEEGVVGADLFANLDTIADIVTVAKEKGIDAGDLTKNVAKDAAVATEMKEFVDQIDDSADAAVATTAFTNITDAGKVLKKAKDKGVDSGNLAKSLADNGDAIVGMKAAVDQLDEIGEAADAGALFNNIVEVGTAIKKAQDKGVDDVELIKNMASNPEKAEQVNQIFEKVGDGLDADAAKNVLGNVADVEQMQEALTFAEQTGGDLNDFIKKDVEEHKALVEVVEQLTAAGGDDAAAKFLEGGIDDALQLKQAFDEGHVDAESLAESISTGETSFEEAFKNSSLTKLNERFAGNADFLEAITLYESEAQDILFALSFVAPGSTQEAALMGNLDKLGAIMHLSHKFAENPQRLGIVFDNLDVAIALDVLVVELGVFPERLNVIFENAGLAPAILATYSEYESLGSYDLINSMFSSSESLRNTISNDGLNKLLRDYPGYSLEIEAFSDRAGEISSLLSQVGPHHADQILANLDKFDDVNLMILRTKGDPMKIEALLSHLHILDQLKSLSDQFKEGSVLGGQDALFANVFLFDQDPAYFEIASSTPKFFVRLAEIAGDLSQVPSNLAFQLKDLGLTRADLEVVLSDLLAGPQVDGPTSTPPEDSTIQAGGDLATLSFLTDHYIPSADDEALDGKVFINPKKVVDSSIAFESSFFAESADLYSEISSLASQESVHTNEFYDHGYFIGGVMGGRNIEFNAATYDLSNLPHDNLLIAASGMLTLNGQLDFLPNPNGNGANELLFMSLDRLSITEGSSVSYAGDSLGFGSLDSIEVISVDLHAEGELSLLSLDSLVINNSSMSTSGNGGADFVHLLAASELSIDNLRFSEQVRQIAMEAMTINLSNLRFPEGSSVHLRSLYGGVDGIYPNFGGMQYGRVNFINEVRYGSNLIDSRAAFDQHGANISIGSIR